RRMLNGAGAGNYLTVLAHPALFRLLGFMGLHHLLCRVDCLGDLVHARWLTSSRERSFNLGGGGSILDALEALDHFLVHLDRNLGSFSFGSRVTWVSSSVVLITIIILLSAVTFSLVWTPE